MLIPYMRSKGYIFVWSEYFVETWWAKLITVNGIDFLIRVYANNTNQLVTTFTDPVVLRIYNADTSEELCDPEPYKSLKDYLGVYLTQKLKSLAVDQTAILLAEI